MGNDIQSLALDLVRLADTGAKQLRGKSLQDLVVDYERDGESFGIDDLLWFIMAGRYGSDPSPAVDTKTLDEETRRLADRGTREIFQIALDELIADLELAGATFDQKDLEGLVLAGKMSIEADSR